MRKLTVTMVLGALVMGLHADDKTLLTEEQKVSYIIGMNMAERVKNDGIKSLDLEALKLGMEDTLTGKKAKISMDEAREIMERFRKRFDELKSEKMKANVRAGETFRAEYAKQAEAKTTRSGLMYRVLRSGAGAKPSPGSMLVAHYRGTLIDGTEFDNSMKNNQGKPVTFSLRNMIAGWQEALPMMPVGAKWELVIPYNLAYGSRSFEPLIGPGATLVFEVELLAVKPAQSQGPPKSEPGR
ncbi:MAG: FKBP-type peptidyl-prolyl cis-trans isomerase [Lentisphaeria bacterium]|nr:FKBP-type peptidyl-prolyl cis-trans isomerase [Lentisphaeria bacterium]